MSNEELETIVLDLRKRIAKLENVAGNQQRTQARAADDAVATDADLDSQYGDPIVKFSPRDWKGEGNFMGSNYSTCPPEFLDVLAEALSYFASRKDSTDPTKASWDRRDAARARGWAKRARAGWKMPHGDAPPPRVGDDDIPF